LEKDEIADTVVCVFCRAVIEGPVEKEVVVVGGDLKFSGGSAGQIVAVMAEVELAPGTRIDKEFVTVLSRFKGDEDSVSWRNRVNVLPPDIIPGGRGGLGLIAALIGWFHALGLLIVFLVLLLIAFIMPDRVRFIAESIPRRYGLALLIGFGVHAVVFFMGFSLWMSGIGVIFAVPLDWGFRLIRILGRAALFYQFGRFVGLSRGREFSVLAAVMTGFLPYALLTTLPFFLGTVGLAFGLIIGALVHVFIDWPAIGLALLTRLGDRTTGGVSVVGQSKPVASTAEGEVATAS
jgi:hypothetical protein